MHGMIHMSHLHGAPSVKYPLVSTHDFERPNRKPKTDQLLYIKAKVLSDMRLRAPQTNRDGARTYYKLEVECGGDGGQGVLVGGRVSLSTSSSWGEDGSNNRSVK